MEALSLSPRLSLSLIQSEPASPMYVDIALHELVSGSEGALSKIDLFVSQYEDLAKEQKLNHVCEDDQNLLLQYRLLMQRARERILPGSPLNERLAGYIGRAIKLQTAINRIETSNVREISFEELFGGFSEEPLDLIGQNIATVQLTTGCSVGCPRCNFNALHKPRRHLSWDAINKIVDRWGEYLKQNKAFFYYSSDPLDWEDKQGRNYFDVLELVKAKCKYSPETKTAIPKGKGELAKRIWESEYGISISVSNVNHDRLTKEGILIVNGNSTRVSFGKPGNPYSRIECTSHKDLQYVAGLDYDFASYENSIGCRRGIYITPDGIYNFASTATTPLTPNGYLRERITPGTQAFFKFANSAHEQRNNLIPYEIISTPKVNSEVKLTDSQCLEAIYQILIDSIYLSQLKRSGNNAVRWHRIGEDISNVAKDFAKRGLLTHYYQIYFEVADTLFEIGSKYNLFTGRLESLSFGKEWQGIREEKDNFLRAFSEEHIEQCINNNSEAKRVIEETKPLLDVLEFAFEKRGERLPEAIAGKADKELSKYWGKTVLRFAEFLDQNENGKNIILKMLGTDVKRALKLGTSGIEFPDEEITRLISRSAHALPCEGSGDHEFAFYLMVHILMLDPNNKIFNKIREKDGEISLKEILDEFK